MNAYARASAAKLQKKLGLNAIKGKKDKNMKQYSVNSNVIV